MADIAKSLATYILRSVQDDEDMSFSDFAVQFRRIEHHSNNNPQLKPAFDKLYGSLYEAKGAIAECITELQEFIEACNRALTKPSP